MATSGEDQVTVARRIKCGFLILSGSHQQRRHVQPSFFQEGSLKVWLFRRIFSNCMHVRRLLSYMMARFCIVVLLFVGILGLRSSRLPFARLKVGLHGGLALVGYALRIPTRRNGECCRYRGKLLLKLPFHPT